MSEAHVEQIPEEPAAPAAPVEPAPATAIESTPPPEPVAVDPAPAAEPAPAEPAPAVEALPEGTLSIAEPIPAEAAPAEGDKPAEEPAAEPPAPEEPIAYEFKVPEGFELPPERAEPLTQWFGTHKIPAEDAQALLDMHYEAMTEARTFERQEQWRVFNEMCVTKRNEIMADPELGGAGYETNKAAAQRALKMFVPPASREAFDQRMRASGMIDDVEFFRAWVNVARRFDEPAPPPPNPAPVANGAGRAPRLPGQRSTFYQFPRGSRQ